MRLAVLEGDAPGGSIADMLISQGLACSTFRSGAALIERLAEDGFDLLILDWTFAEGAALGIVEWTQAQLAPAPPILMIADQADADAILAGLSAGADDFLTRPLRAPVLLARVHAVLRRAYPLEQVGRAETFGSHVFDPARLVVSVEGEEVQLTAKEYGLALALFRNLHKAVGRAYLLESVWGRNPALATRTLDAHVSKIRAKLSLRPQRGYLLAPVYSYGYRLERLAEATDDKARIAPVR